MSKLYKPVAIILLLAAIVCLYGWWSSGSAIEKRIEGNKSLLPYDVDRYIFWRGENALRNLIAEKSKVSDVLFFDGSNRWACLLEHYDDKDRLAICQFGRIDGPRIGMMWICPKESRIVDVNFENKFVEIAIANTKPGVGQKTAIVDWRSIESETGSGHFGDYFSDNSTDLSAD